MARSSPMIAALLRSLDEHQLRALDTPEERIDAIERRLDDMLPKIVKVLDLLHKEQQAISQRLNRMETES